MSDPTTFHGHIQIVADILASYIHLVDLNKQRLDTQRDMIDNLTDRIKLLEELPDRIGRLTNRVDEVFMIAANRE